MKEWKSFKEGNWVNNIDVDNFISLNYKGYLGNEDFLCGKTLKTKKVWNKCCNLLKKELESHVLDIDTENMQLIGYEGSSYTLYEDDGIHKDYNKKENYRVLTK